MLTGNAPSNGLAAGAYEAERKTAAHPKFLWGLIGERWTTATGLHPEGMSAISRGASEATPPEEV